MYTATHYLQHTVKHTHCHSLYGLLMQQASSGLEEMSSSLTGSEQWRHSSMAGCVEVWHQMKPVIKASWKPVICAHCLLPGSSACPVITPAAQLHARCIALVNVITGMLLSAGMYVLCCTEHLKCCSCLQTLVSVQTHMLIHFFLMVEYKIRDFYVRLFLYSVSLQWAACQAQKKMYDIHMCCISSQKDPQCMFWS